MKNKVLGAIYIGVEEMERVRVEKMANDLAKAWGVETPFSKKVRMQVQKDFEDFERNFKKEIKK